MRPLIQVLAQPQSPRGKAAAAAALTSLMLNGQAAAVAAADSSNVVAPALEWAPNSSETRAV